MLKHAEILLGILLRIMPAIVNQVLYVIKAKLEGTVCYAGFLLAPAEGLGLRGSKMRNPPLVRLKQVHTLH